MVNNRWELNTEEVEKVCRKNGLAVDEEQARFILDFISILAEAAFNPKSDHEKSNSIHQSKHGRTGR